MANWLQWRADVWGLVQYTISVLHAALMQRPGGTKISAQLTKMVREWLPKYRATRAAAASFRSCDRGASSEDRLGGRRK